MDSPPKKPLARLLNALVAKATAFSYLLVAVGVLGFLVLPVLQRRNNFDENALLAGSAKPVIRSRTPWALDNAHLVAESYGSVYQSGNVTTWLQHQMLQLGMDVYSHTFRAARSATKRRVPCTNVHGILRADRGDAKESILLVTPLQYSAPASDFQQSRDAAGFALSLGWVVLTHLATVPWLAKDLIWVVPDASCGLEGSMNAWVNTYQSVGAAWHDESFGRAGVLQQAIVLEVPTADFNSIQLSVEGYDGQLPKLDMYWLLKHYSSSSTSLPVLLRGQVQAAQLAEHFKDTPQLQNYIQSLAVLAQFAWRQARGLPLGAHAAFKRYNVDAVTIRLVHQPELPARYISLSTSLGQLAEVLELSLRSCNMLIEKFHHSLFLYLQTSPEHHVSIDMYIIAPVALLACLLLQAAASKQAHDAIPAEQRSQGWTSSIRRVLITHVVCALLGLGLRRLLQQGGAAGTGAAAELLDLPGLEASSINSWLAGGCTVVLLAAVVRGSSSSSRAASRHCSSTGTVDKEQDGGEAGATAASKLQIKVILGSFAAMTLSALVCLNWALAYMCLLLVAPLAVMVSSTPAQQTQDSSSHGAGCSQQGRRPLLLQHLAAALMSPAAVVVYLLLISGNGSPSLAELSDMVVASRGLAFMVFCAVYVPFWWIACITL